MIEQDINLTERWQAGDRIQAASLYKGEQDNGEDEDEEEKREAGAKAMAGKRANQLTNCESVKFQATLLVLSASLTSLLLLLLLLFLATLST
ncbi:hypothetical protein ACLKA7_000244 [Drosophila subpalustris]